MTANELKIAIETLHPTGLVHRTGLMRTDMDSERVRRILSHYAARPGLHGRAVELAIGDIVGVNVRDAGKVKKPKRLSRRDQRVLEARNSENVVTLTEIGGAP